MALRIEDIVASVVKHPGTSVGIDAATLVALWNAVGDSLKQSMLQKKSIIVTRFAHFMVQKQQVASGTWGLKTVYIPQVVLLPVFCEAYGVRKPVSMRVAHVGASVPMKLNASTIGTKVQAPRHAVNNGLQDIIRAIGDTIAAGRSLVLEWDFCRMEFGADRSYSVRWEESFAQSFVKPIYIAPAAAASQGQHTEDIPTHVAPNPVPAPPSTAKADTAIPRRPQTAKAVLTVRLGEKQSSEAGPAALGTQQVPARPMSARIPAPPPAVAVTSTAPQTIPAPQPETPRPSSARAMSSSPRNYHQTPTPSPARSLTVKAALDRLKEIDLSPYQKRKTRKSLYRQLRNRAYEESWETQMGMKRMIAEEDRERDRQKVEAFRDFIAQEQKKDLEKAIARRKEEQDIEKLNKTLLFARQPLGIPKLVEAGDIFDKRLPTFEAKADKQFLATQQELARQRRQADAEQDMVFGQRAAQLAIEAEAEKLAAAKERRAAQQKLATEYQEEIRRHKEDEARYKRELTNGGALLFSGDDDAKSEAVDKRRVLEASRSVQETNKKVAIDHARQAKEEMLERRAKLKRDQENFARNEHLLALQAKRQKLTVQNSLRSSWDQSISEKTRRRSVEREANRLWREHNYLQNESSDEES